VPQSFVCLDCHLVFSTKNRQPWIESVMADRLYGEPFERRGGETLHRRTAGASPGQIVPGGVRRFVEQTWRGFRRALSMGLMARRNTRFRPFGTRLLGIASRGSRPWLLTAVPPGRTADPQLEPREPRRQLGQQRRQLPLRAIATTTGGSNRNHNLGLRACLARRKLEDIRRTGQDPVPAPGFGRAGANPRSTGGAGSPSGERPARAFLSEPSLPPG